jgi:hypothetical protein
VANAAKGHSKADRTIRILHLSDLLIGNASSALENFDHILGRFGPDARGKEQQRLPWVDYVVVCGNITAHGLESEFQTAASWLERLAHAVINTEHDAPLERVIATPGTCDVPVENGRRDFRPFNEFLQCLHAASSGQAPECGFQDGEPLVSELKDGTFIVAPYFDQCGATLDDIFEKAAGKLTGFEYCNNTPTILVTAESPVVNWRQRQRLSQKGRSIAEDRLRINFHLFGPAPVTIVPFEPFVFRHVGISTGPRKAEGFWPLRVNNIEISTTTASTGKATAESGKVYQRYRVATSSMEDRTARWESEVWTRNNPFTFHSFQPAVSRTYVESHPELIQSLTEWLNGHQSSVLMRLEHIPGSGLSECLGLLTRKRLPGNWKVKLLEIPNTRPESGAAWGEKLNDHFEKKVLPELQRLEPGTLLIIRDDSYIFQSADDARRWVDRIKEAVEQLASGETRVLYLVTPRVAENEFPGIDKLTVGPVSVHSSFDYARGYEWLLPFMPKVVENLTGGALKLKEALLRQALALFGTYKGTYRVSRESICELIQTANNSDVMDTYRITTEIIEQMEAGQRMLTLIRDILSTNQDTCRVTPLTRTLSDPPPGLAEIFVTQGFLARTIEGPFSLRAAGPFMMSDLPELDWSARYDEDGEGPI